MKISALLTSAGINIGVCIFFSSLYSVLRKQPSTVSVYFAQRLASVRRRHKDGSCFDRFIPSASWVMTAWKTTEEEILDIGGLDAVVFNRLIIFSIRIFSIAAAICILLVLPVNYNGQDRIHKKIPSESFEAFTIVNVAEGSRWLWAHCLALYVISFSACVLLYFEYKRIACMRLVHLGASPPNPSHFTLLVRSIPWSPKDSYSESVRKFFTRYHGSSYLSHQMVHPSGTVQKLLNDAEKICKKIDDSIKPSFMQCVNSKGSTNSFKILSKRSGTDGQKSGSDELDTTMREKDCPAAFVFFKTRYAAVSASKVLQTSNPMLWVINLAPEPHDVYWSNLWIPYRQLWLRRIATLLAAIVLVFLFLVPVTFVQGLAQLEKLQKMFPFLRKIPEKDLMIQLLTGYLPSVILILFLYIIPPVMMLFSSIEGPVSHSGRKRSACYKVLYFLIWNVFFVNSLSGTVISQLDVITTPRNIPTALAKGVSAQASFFITYVLTSGWASLSFELMQVFGLLCNLFRKIVLRIKNDSADYAPSFPYHTEVPKVLLFGLLGYTFSILAPLILPFLLIYFLLAYLVYRNQFINVYITRYESGGQFWPIVHNTTIFSLVLTQIIAIGMFGLKKSPVSSIFTVVLVVCTLLFNEYCRQRFHPIFKSSIAEVFIDMDTRDQQSGKLEEIYEQLQRAYCQFNPSGHETCNAENQEPSQDSENGNSGKEPDLKESWTVCCDLEGEPSKK